jgi:hypothetical protein
MSTIYKIDSYIHMPENIDPYNTSPINIGDSGQSLKTLFEGMRKTFYVLVDCLHEKNRKERIQILGIQTSTTLETLLVNMAMTCWTNKGGNAKDIESLHNKKDMLRFNRIPRKTVSDFMDGLSNVPQNKEIDERTWKGKILSKISSLELQWNAIWYAEYTSDEDEGVQSPRDTLMISLLQQLKVLC